MSSGDGVLVCPVVCEKDCANPPVPAADAPAGFVDEPNTLLSVDEQPATASTMPHIVATDFQHPVHCPDCQLRIVSLVLDAIGRSTVQLYQCNHGKPKARSRHAGDLVKP